MLKKNLPMDQETSICEFSYLPRLPYLPRKCFLVLSIDSIGFDNFIQQPRLKARFINSLCERKCFWRKNYCQDLLKTRIERFALKICAHSYFCDWPYCIWICKPFPFRYKIHAGILNHVRQYTNICARQFTGICSHWHFKVYFKLFTNLRCSW